MSVVPASAHPNLSASLRAALACLAQAHLAAEECRRPPRDFAVDVSQFPTEVLPTDLRWLVSQGYAEHLLETTGIQARRRSFRRLLHLALGARSCFLLTAAGHELAGQIEKSLKPKWGLAPQEAVPVPILVSGSVAPQHAVPVPISVADSKHLSVSPKGQPGTELPFWDTKHRRLWLAGRLVKSFRGPVGTQEMLVIAFAEQDWQRLIDDPLTRGKVRNPKRRLRDAIAKLNRKQMNALLRFHGDGTGQGVRWERLPPTDSTSDSTDGNISDNRCGNTEMLDTPK